MANENNTEYKLKITAEMDQSIEIALSALTEVVTDLARRFRGLQNELKELSSTENIDTTHLQNELKQMGNIVYNLSKPIGELSTTSKSAQRDMENWARSLDRSEQELTQLPIKINKITEELQLLALAGDTSSARVNALQAELNRLQTMQGGLSGATRNLGRAGRQMRQNVSNIGFQIQDMIVSLQNGTRASVAFTQQVPQALTGFGRFGSIAGVAATVIGVVAASYIDDLYLMLDASKALEDATEALAESYDKLGETVKGVSLDGFIESLKQTEDAQVRLLALSTDQTFNDILTKNKTVIKETTTALGKELVELSKDFRPLLANIAFDAEDLGIDDLVLGLQLSGKEAQAFLDILNDINPRENLDILTSAANRNKETYETLIPLLAQYGQSLITIEDIERKRTESRELALARLQGYQSYLEKLGQIEAEKAAKTLTDETAINAAYEQKLLTMLEFNKITKEQYDALTKIKTEVEDISKEYSQWISDYNKLLEKSGTLEQQREREIASVKELQKNLEGLAAAGGLDFIVDAQVFKDKIRQINEEFDTKAAEEYYNSLSDVGKAFFDLQRESEKTQQNLKDFNNLKVGSTEKEFLSLVEAMGDAAPLSDRLTANLIKMNDSARYVSNVQNAVLALQKELNLTDAEAKELAKSLGAAFDEAVLTDFQKGLDGVIDNGIGGLTDAFLELAQTGKISFSDLINSILADLSRMYLNTAFQDIFGFLRPVAGSGNSGGNQSGSGSGGTILAFSSPSAGQSSVSAVLPLASIPTAAASSRSAGTTVNINNNSMSEATVNQSRTSDGGTKIDVMINNSVEAAISKGRFDKTFNNIYGMRRKGI